MIMRSRCCSWCGFNLLLVGFPVQLWCILAVVYKGPMRLSLCISVLFNELLFIKKKKHFHKQVYSDPLIDHHHHHPKENKKYEFINWITFFYYADLFVFSLIRFANLFACINPWYAIRMRSRKWLWIVKGTRKENWKQYNWVILNIKPYVMTILGKHACKA